MYQLEIVRQIRLEAYQNYLNSKTRYEVYKKIELETYEIEEMIELEELERDTIQSMKCPH